MVVAAVADASASERTAPGDHGEAGPRLARPRRLDRRVEREQVGLEREGRTSRAVSTIPARRPGARRAARRSRPPCVRAPRSLRARPTSPRSRRRPRAWPPRRGAALQHRFEPSRAAAHVRAWSSRRVATSSTCPATSASLTRARPRGGRRRHERRRVAGVEAGAPPSVAARAGRSAAGAAPTGSACVRGSLIAGAWAGALVGRGRRGSRLPVDDRRSKGLAAGGAAARRGRDRAPVRSGRVRSRRARPRAARARPPGCPTLAPHLRRRAPHPARAVATYGRSRGRGCRGRRGSWYALHAGPSRHRAVAPGGERAGRHQRARRRPGASVVQRLRLEQEGGVRQPRPSRSTATAGAARLAAARRAGQRPTTPPRRLRSAHGTAPRAVRPRPPPRTRQRYPPPTPTPPPRASAARGAPAPPPWPSR
jgi:hypothetical protein